MQIQVYNYVFFAVYLFQKWWRCFDPGGDWASILLRNKNKFEEKAFMFVCNVYFPVHAFYV